MLNLHRSRFLKLITLPTVLTVFGCSSDGATDGTGSQAGTGAAAGAGATDNTGGSATGGAGTGASNTGGGDTGGGDTGGSGGGESGGTGMGGASGGSDTGGSGGSTGGATGGGDTGGAGGSSGGTGATGGTGGGGTGGNGNPQFGSCDTPNAFSCAEDPAQLKLFCYGGVWTPIGSCDGNTNCNPSNGKCEEMVPECQGKAPGARFCRNDVVHECNPRLLTSTVIDSCDGVCVESGNSASCSAPVCGDGKVNQASEQCDDGNSEDTDGCIACKTAKCGDGFVNFFGGEECDDANALDTDGCIACQNAECGDGFTEAGVEECDDANFSNSDACAECKNATCGDDHVQTGVEECEDGNTDNTDWCVSCMYAECGDGGVYDGIEQCDDGNASSTDACIACVPAVCGDGQVWADVEQCDDANSFDNDGCISCVIAKCGDGIVRDDTEACDDGNQVDDDACTNGCALSCGDGVIQAKVEECDDENGVYGDGCAECHMVAAIEADSNITCELDTGGRVKCWGGGVGDAPGEMGAALKTVKFAAGRKAVSIAGGEYHRCAILDNGALTCWGYNSYGQLGYGNTNYYDETSMVMPTVNLGPGRTVKGVAVGGNHTCVILDNGSVKCWGDNGYGQLGLGDDDAHTTMGDALATVDLGAGRTAKAISAGDNHTCAILDNDTLKCWGLGSSGQLGLGDSSNRGDGPNEMGGNLPAVNLGTGAVPKAISSAYRQNCVILTTNAVKCWGYNSFGQLGNGNGIVQGTSPSSMGDNLPTVDLGPSRTAKAISTGQRGTCAILDNDVVKCWGDNDSGQLGQGDQTDRGAPANSMGANLLPIDLGSGHTAKAITAATYHACALLDDDTVKCWGEGGYLGIGSTNDRGDAPGEMGDNLPTLELP